MKCLSTILKLTSQSKIASAREFFSHITEVSMQTRIEHDTMGEIEVPNEAL